MKLILSSCDFGHPESAKFIYQNLWKPITNCRVLTAVDLENFLFVSIALAFSCFDVVDFGNHL